MFENLELTCHLISFDDEFIVAPSWWKPLDADVASVCRESRQILQYRETCSQSMQAPLTLKVKPLLISTYTFDTNIRWNKIAIYSVRFDVKSTWFDSLLCHFVLFHSTAYPRWWVAFLARQTNSMPKIRCPRNASLDNDDIDSSQMKPADITPIPDTDISVFLVSSWPQISTNLLRTVHSLVNAALTRYFADSLSDSELMYMTTRMTHPYIECLCSGFIIYKAFLCCHVFKFTARWGYGLIANHYIWDCMFFMLYFVYWMCPNA